MKCLPNKQKGLSPGSQSKEKASTETGACNTRAWGQRQTDALSLLPVTQLRFNERPCLKDKSGKPDETRKYIKQDNPDLDGQLPHVLGYVEILVPSCSWKYLHEREKADARKIQERSGTKEKKPLRRKLLCNKMKVNVIYILFKV